MLNISSPVHEHEAKCLVWYAEELGARMNPFRQRTTYKNLQRISASFPTHFRL